MDEKKQFLSLLSIPKRKLLIEHHMHYFHSGLFLAVIFTFIIALIARFFVVLHLNEIMMIFPGIILLTAIVIAFFKKPDNFDAAALFDDYVTEDRVSTALTYLQEETETVWVQLQRRDALSYMKRLSPKIKERKLKLFYWKTIFTMLFVISLTTISIFTPNDVMKIAKQQDIDEQITKESKEEIKKIPVMKDKANEHLEELKNQTKEIKESEALLKKLMEKEAILDIEKKDGLHKEQQLEKLAEEVNDFKALSDAVKKKDSEKMKEALEQLMEKFADLTKLQQKDLENMISEATENEVNNVAELTEEQMRELTASLENQLDKLTEGAQSINQLAMLQEKVKQLATSLNQNMTNAGLSSSNQLAFASQNASNRNKGNGGQNQKGQSQNGNSKGDISDGNGQGTGNGSGSGKGSGSGNGSGDGSGSGTSGSGSGRSGNGAGSGAGFGQGSRDLTIPEKIDGKETVENDFGQLGEGSGEQQIAPEAPVLNGTVRSYEEVYGNYEHAYRESVERMDLPGYLEDVVKEYFSDLNPEGD